MDKAQELHASLYKVYAEVNRVFPCKIIEAHRGMEAQNKAFAEGKSKLKFPESKHNKMPSLAMDLMPLPIDFNDVKKIIYFAGFVMATAARFGIKLTWGGDWNGDLELKDNRFNDLVHFELKDGK